MPNIEIHSLKPCQVPDCLNKIRAAFRESSYAKDVITTEVHDVATGFMGEPRPFLRVIFAENDTSHVDGVLVYGDCLERLATLNMDIEVVVIREFIPKKE